MSAPIAVMIFMMIEPTYEAVSILRIDPAVPDILSPLRNGVGESQNSIYLNTQVNLSSGLTKYLTLPLPIPWSRTSPRSRSRQIPRMISLGN